MGTIYKLIIEDDEGKTTVYPLSQGEISIGRKEGNTIRLMERNVSRRHARLLRSNGSVFVEDLDSYNGIRINGERINGRYEVKEGDLVEIGDYHLALQAAEVEEESPPPEPTPSRSEPEGARDQWPLAGTVPDFRLPEEILAGVRQAQPTPGAQKAAPRDTLVDQPTPLAAPTPAVSAPAKPASFLPPPLGESAQARDDGGRRELPPFPSPGTPSSGSPLFGGGRLGSVTEQDTRPPALKPQSSSPAPQPAKKDPEPLAATTPINVGPARMAAVPRLVCVSTSYAGKEFALTRPELIIGRVEDNDIVIEHRSVSRNHAKIVFDGRAHKIIDLQSANGILVNGEEYAMTDLRKGDLIELGHVRFRFVPAGEAFVATDDELREMKEAGVTPPIANDPPAPVSRPLESVTQPHFGAPAAVPQQAAMPKLSAPSKPHDAPDVPGFDPSTAATVTDTPLSALAMGQMMTPQIESSPAPERSLPLPPRRPEPAHDRRDTERPERRDSDRRDTLAPRAAPLDQRPTEHAVNTRQNGAQAGSARHAPSERTNVVEVEGTLADKPRSKTGLVVALAVGVVALIAVAVLLLSTGGGDATAMRALNELYKAKNWKGATEFCKTNQKAIETQAEAMKMCFDAAAQLAAQPKEEPQKDPGGALEPKNNPSDPKPAGDVKPADAKPEENKVEQAVAEPPAGETDDATDDADARRAKAGTKKATTAKATDKTAAKTTTAPSADKVQRARELHDKGWRSWNAGDASKAIELLTQCVSIANLPKCHRTLGTVYAQLGDTRKALDHYKRYLELDPNASDVPRVREIIREVESQP